MHSCVYIIVIAVTIFEGICLGSERVAFFVTTEDRHLLNTAQDVEYYFKRHLEKRMYIPAKIINREIAVFEDEINRQKQETANLIVEGKKLYEEFKLDQSFFVFQKIINNLEMMGTAATKKSKDYQLALMFLGNIYHLKGEIQSARETFTKLLIYNNKYLPDTNYFSPDIIETFEKVRSELKNIKKGSLQIIPKPEDSQVFVDGKFIGAGTYKLEDLYIGEHIVSVQKIGYIPSTKKVDVKSDLMEVVNIQLVDFKEISGRYQEIMSIKESNISTEIHPILKAFKKDANAEIVVMAFVSGSKSDFTISGYTYYRDRLVSYNSVNIKLTTDSSRKKLLRTKIDELLKNILPDNINSLKPITGVRHKKFYTSWWFYCIMSATLIGAGALGYLFIGGEDKEDNRGALIISF